jgi:hypothetical protein
MHPIASMTARALIAVGQGREEVELRLGPQEDGALP